MRHFILFMLLALVTSTSLASEEINCNPEGNQLEMNACAGDDLAKADKALNETYQAIFKKYSDDPLFIRKFRSAQKAWLAFRDAELDARFVCAETNIRLCWGSMYPMLYGELKAELTRDRERQLKLILENGPGR